MGKTFCYNTNCLNFRSGQVQIIGGKKFPGNCNLTGLEVDRNGLCLKVDPIVISIDNGHATLNKSRKCPLCGEPTILHDSGWETCSECNWKER